MIEAVELCHQNDCHDEEGDGEGFPEKILRLLLFLILALEDIGDFRVDIGFIFQPRLNFLNLFIHQNTGDDIRLDGHNPLSVGAVDVPDLLARLTLDEIGDWHHAAFGHDPQIVELVHGSLVIREPEPDIDFIVRVIWAVFIRLDSVGDKLNGFSNCLDVGAKPSGLCPIHRNLPFNAGDGTAILDIDQVRHIVFEVIADFLNLDR